MKTHGCLLQLTNFLCLLSPVPEQLKPKCVIEMKGRKGKRRMTELASLLQSCKREFFLVVTQKRASTFLLLKRNSCTLLVFDGLLRPKAHLDDWLQELKERRERSSTHFCWSFSCTQIDDDDDTSSFFASQLFLVNFKSQEVRAMFVFRNALESSRVSENSFELLPFSLITTGQC